MAATLACSVATAAAQTGLQRPMLPSSAQWIESGEGTAPAPATSVASALQELAAQARVIFTGSVVQVDADTAGGALVRFRVERGIRGVHSGAEYRMRVSAWAGGAERYHPGERALFLLTAPSVSGYSAPVMGEHGIVPLSGDTLVGNLDLRWIATDVLRGTPGSDQGRNDAGQLRSAAVLASGAAPSSTTGKLQQDVTTTTPLAMPDVHAIDRDLILDLLRNGTAATGQTR